MPPGLAKMEDLARAGILGRGPECHPNAGKSQRPSKKICKGIKTKCKILQIFKRPLEPADLRKKCKTLSGQGCCLEDDLPLLSAIVACFRQNGNFFRPQPLSRQLMINSVRRRNRSPRGRSRQLVPFSTAAAGLVAVVERRDM